MPFTATEGSTQPIVLGKEPVARPVIERGPIGLDETSGRLPPDIWHRDGTVTFCALDESGDFVLTYHRCALTSELLNVVNVAPDTVVTWELAGP